MNGQDEEAANHADMIKNNDISYDETKGGGYSKRKKKDCFLNMNQLADKNFSCSVCQKMYKIHSRLQIHLRTHTKEKPFQCLICSKGFNEKGNYTCHMRIHTGERPFPCTFNGCTMKFKTQGQLNSHFNLHFNICPYQCSQCQRKFKRKERLNIHMLSHTGEKPHICVHCSKAFREKSNMVAHSKRHALPNENSRLSKRNNSIKLVNSNNLYTEELENTSIKNEVKIDFLVETFLNNLSKNVQTEEEENIEGSTHRLIENISFEL